MFTSLMQTRFHSQHSFHVIFVCNAFGKIINSEICWYDFRCHRKNKIRTQSQENSFTQIWLLIVCILADFWGFVAMLIRLSFMIRVVFFLYQTVSARRDFAIPWCYVSRKNWILMIAMNTSFWQYQSANIKCLPYSHWGLTRFIVPLWLNSTYKTC